MKVEKREDGWYAGEQGPFATRNEARAAKADAHGAAGVAGLDVDGAVAAAAEQDAQEPEEPEAEPTTGAERKRLDDDLVVRARQAARDNAYARIKQLRDRGLSLGAIAVALNEQDVPTLRGVLVRMGVDTAPQGREDQADTRREIVRLRKRGLSYGAVARQLNEAGTPTFGGADGWRPQAVRRVLVQEGLVAEKVKS